jgi:hypothetical protein
MNCLQLDFLSSCGMRRTETRAAGFWRYCVLLRTNIVLSKAGTPMTAGADKPPTLAPPSAPPSAGSGFARQPKYASWLTPQQRVRPSCC